MVKSVCLFKVNFVMLSTWHSLAHMWLLNKWIPTAFTLLLPFPPFIVLTLSVPLSCLLLCLRPLLTTVTHPDLPSSETLATSYILLFNLSFSLVIWLFQWNSVSTETMSSMYFEYCLPQNSPETKSSKQCLLTEQLVRSDLSFCHFCLGWHQY